MQTLTPHDRTTVKTSLALAFLVVVALAAMTGTASANGTCMTQREFAHIHKGQTVAQVARIIGSAGHIETTARAGTITAQVRSWHTCTPHGAGSASFLNGRLTAKAGVFS